MEIDEMIDRLDRLQNHIGWCYKTYGDQYARMKNGAIPKHSMYILAIDNFNKAFHFIIAYITENKVVINDEQAARLMDIVLYRGAEVGHEYGDMIMGVILVQHGYGKTWKLFEESERWYS